MHAQERDRDGGVGYAQRLTTIAMAGLAVVTLLAVLVAPVLTRLYGITGDPAQVALANWLARLLLIEIVFYGVGALAQAILNSRDVFGPPAWAPVLNNVVVIAPACCSSPPAARASSPRSTITAGPGLAARASAPPWASRSQALVLLPLLRGPACRCGRAGA